MSRGIFITGTDTEVGKTVISCAVLRCLNDHGLKTAAMKPIASGAKNINGVFVNDDALALQGSASVQNTYELINPYIFEPAIAPHIAAEQAGVEIEFEKIKRCYEQISDNADFTVVEGVGGWLVPLNKQATVADLALHLELPVILVVGMRLGCLNHALLSVDSIRNKGARLIGWIANHVEPDFPFAEDNIKTLTEMIDEPLLGTSLYQGKLDLDVNRFLETGL